MSPSHAAAVTAADAPRATGGGEALDVLVIGAGQAGLALAWHLTRRRRRYLVVDAAPEIGHSWRTRWDSLRLFTPSQYAGLPGTPFPAPPDTYPTKDQVADYLSGYARAHALPVLTATRVARLEPTDDGFTAHTSQGPLRARQVVVATGPFQHPHVPDIARGFGDDLAQLHSADYRNPDRLPDGPILVVGGGNSGRQIAEEVAATRPVTLAEGGRPLGLPQRLGGRDLFWWLTVTGILGLSAESRLGRRLRSRPDLIVGTSRRRLMRAGVALRPRLIAADRRTARFGDGTGTVPAAVVWATGYRPDYSWIDAPVTAEGWPAHHQGRGSLPGLWFLGLPWQRSRGSALLGFVQDDAACLAERLDRVRTR